MLAQNRATLPADGTSAAARTLAIPCLLLFAARPSAAQDRAGASVTVYADDDQGTVGSPRASADVDLSDRLSVHAGYDADVITAATIDVRTSATPRAFHEARHGGTLGATIRLDRQTQLVTSLRGSAENDFDLLGGSVGLSRDLRDQAVTLSFGYGVEHALVGRARDSTFAEHQWGQRANAGAALVIDRRTVAALTYSLGLLVGYQASPYRFVPIHPADPAVQSRPVYVPERLPTVRERHALALEVRHAAGSDLFLSGHLGGYVDGWGMEAGSVQVELERRLFDDRLALGARARGYLQSRARFHEERYETWPEVPLHVSGDRELGRMGSLLGGVSGEIRVAQGRTGELWLRAGVDFMRFWYLDFALLEARTAWLSAIGAMGRR